MVQCCIVLVLTIWPVAQDAKLAVRVKTLEAKVLRLESQIAQLREQMAALRPEPAPAAPVADVPPASDDIQRRTVEALAGMTRSQRLQAAGLREFLKTATVEQYGRLGTEAMQLIRRVPELSYLVEKRGLSAGLAQQYGFGTPKAAQ